MMKGWTSTSNRAKKDPGDTIQYKKMYGLKWIKDSPYMYIFLQYTIM